MKLFLSCAMGLALSTLASLPASAAGKVCLHVRDIASSTPASDGAAITFKMHDGRVWRNDLKSACPSLKFNGFAWRVPSSETVCDDEVSLKVLQSGEICQIGKFTQLTSAPPG